MDRSDGATLAFKLAGLYVLVEAVKLLPTVTPNIAPLLAELTPAHKHDVEIVIGALALSILVLGVIGWVLIVRARRMADRMVGGGQAIIDFSGQVAVAQVVAFSVIGAVMLADGLPHLVLLCANLLLLHSQIWGYLHSEWDHLLIMFLELTIGYWLFFMPRSAARLWLAWSDARATPPPPAPTAPPTAPPEQRRD